MKIISISVFTLSICATGAVAADARLNDLDFIRANRCAGLAKTLANVIDADQLNARIKAERNMRSDYVSERAGQALSKARKEAGDESRREALTEELAGPCAALVGPPGAMASR